MIKNIFQEIRFPLIIWTLISAFLLGVHAFSTSLGYELTFLGVYPRTIHGLFGILTSPFVHGSWEHLFSNLIPLFVFGMIGAVYYRKIFYKSMLFVALLSGFWVWLGARESYHIGASGVVYGMAFFLFLLGMIHFRKDRIALQIAMFVSLFYGGMVWGLLPLVPEISWESHWFGAVSGIILAFFYRKNTPIPPQYDWEIRDDLPDSGIWDYKKQFPPPEGFTYPEEES